MSTDSDTSLLTGDDLPPSLFERYWLGETSPVEAARVEAWFRVHPDGHAWYAGLGGLLAADDGPVRTPDEWARREVGIFEAPQIRGAMRSGLVGENEVAGGATVKKLFGAWPQRRLVPHAFRRAAGFGVALGAVILLLFAARSYQPHHRSIVPVLPSREVATRRGERATLDLADGTRVILAPESRLRVSAAYTAGTGFGARDVELDGEAYFEVKHTAARPFRVRTAVGIAEDLGTEFVVTAYAETRDMRVLVASGEVVIHQTHDTARSLARLRSGDLARLDAQGVVDLRQGVDARRTMAWTLGRLVFVKTPVPDAIAVLQRWYDVEFQLGDVARNVHSVTVTFDRSSSVQNVVEFFEVLLHARAERHGRVVTFSAIP